MWGGAACQPAGGGGGLHNSSLVADWWAGPGAGAVEWSSWPPCSAPFLQQPIHPGERCGVELGRDGELLLPQSDRSIRLEYGEFCLTGLDPSLGRGDSYVFACLPPKPDTILFPWYTCLLGVSLLCLLATIVLYITSPELANPSNKIMINFTVCMFLAYSALLLVHLPELIPFQAAQFLLVFLEVKWRPPKRLDAELSDLRGVMATSSHHFHECP